MIENCRGNVRDVFTFLRAYTRLADNGRYLRRVVLACNFMSCFLCAVHALRANQRPRMRNENACNHAQIYYEITVVIKFTPFESGRAQTSCTSGDNSIIEMLLFRGRSSAVLRLANSTSCFYQLTYTTRRHT